MNDPQLAIFPGMGEGQNKAEHWGPCGCWTCVGEFMEAQEKGASMFMPFIVCDLCGNKRCPKATHHDNACSGSNEPGQEGSRYA